MNYYQVNQNETFTHEFRQGYLCCPEGSRGGWPLMRDLRAGDVLFHYNSSRGAVLGISRVVKIGRHKGTASSHVSVIDGTECIQYRGKHLSEAEFDYNRRRHLAEKYPTYYEVHAERILERNLGKLLDRTPQVYLLAIDKAVAERFLAGCHVRL